MYDENRLFKNSFAVPAAGQPLKMAELPRHPADVIRDSALIAHACRTVAEAAASVHDDSLRRACFDLLSDPRLRFLKRWNDPDKAAHLHGQLVQRGLIDPAKTSAADLFPPEGPVQPFETTPGSGWDSHHAYPGGLAVHVALNIDTSLFYCDMYQRYFGCCLDRDAIITAQIAHDIAKCQIHSWNSDGTFRTDYPVAGKGGHLVMSLAESIERGLPASVILAQACAHVAPNKPEKEAEVVDCLAVAALMAERDPVELGLLAPGEKELPKPHRHEWFAVHFGDGDYVLSMPAATRAVALLRRLAAEQYGMNESDLYGARFNAFRNYVGAHISFMKIDELNAAQGFEAVREAVAALVHS